MIRQKAMWKKMKLMVVCFAALFIQCAVAQSSASAGVQGSVFYSDFHITFGQQVSQFYQSDAVGQTVVNLGLDQSSGSGFRSNYPYLFGSISVNVKLVAGNSAGTVTSFYLASIFKYWCELDFEFLGNVTGEPYILQTNVFAEGKGEREQRIYLWFDPSADYHKYGVLWNQDLILFLVDDVVIRVFHNCNDIGIPYLDYQPLYIYSSLWNGESWATRGGRDKCDWSAAPFIASYTSFDIQACAVKTLNLTEIDANTDFTGIWACYRELYSSDYGQPDRRTLTTQQIDNLNWIKSNYLIYDYCTDIARFNYTTPKECYRNWPVPFTGLPQTNQTQS